MKKLEELKRGFTHGGRFHTDDVIATAFLLFFNKNIEIIRLNQYAGEGGDDDIVYDIGYGKYDHHQENRKINDEGNPYSAFGLIWEDYGRYYLKCNNIEHIEEAFNLFKTSYVFKIDKGDNKGYKDVYNFYENDMIMKCNPLWYEEEQNDNLDEFFFKAVKLGVCILDSWTRCVKKKVDIENDKNSKGGIGK